MNNVIARIKLFFGIILVGIVCASLTVYVNAQAAVVVSESAQILTKSYAVGTEYDGIITRQYVSVGDRVKTGEKVFALSSDTLKEKIQSEAIDPDKLNHTLTDNNELVFTASRSGIVADVAFNAGSFVKEGDVVLTISDTDKATVRAEYYLSGPQYAKLNPTTPAIVMLSGHKQTAGKITSIDQRSRDGRTVTIIEVSVEKLDASQTVYVNSSPVSMELMLDDNTLFERLKRTAYAHLK